MKRILLLLFIISFKIISAQNFWEKINFPFDSTSFYSVHSLITNSSDHILAGTFAKGIYKSTDNGNNWIESGLANHWVIEFAKNNSGDLFAASIGSQFGSGVFKSTDDGSSWNKVWDAQTAMHCIYIDQDQNIYVGLNYYETSGGIFRSTDNGTSWNQIFNLAENVYSVLKLSSGRVLAAGYGKIFYSDNDGTTWNTTTNGLVNSTPSQLVLKNQNEIFLSTLGYGIYKSTDNGISWVNKTGAGPEYSCLLITQDGSMFAGTRGYWVYRSTNGGENWGLINTGMGEDRYVLSLLTTSDGYLFAGLDYYGMYRSVNKVTDVDIDETAPPEKFYLYQNYPNPFNPSTSIQYAIGSRQFVQLKVYDVLGEEIATLVNEEKPAGSYNVQFTLNNLSSGIYFYQLKAGNYLETKKMSLLK